MCPLCSHPNARSALHGTLADSLLWSCPSCGQFILEGDAATVAPSAVVVNKLQELARLSRENGEGPPRVTARLIEKIVTGTPLLRHVSLTLQAGDEPPVSVTGDLSLPEEAILRAFLKEAEAVLAAAWVRSGMPYGARGTITGNDLAASATLPPWEQVQSVLHRARPLLLQSESTYLPAVANIVSRRFVNDTIRTIMSDFKNEFLLTKERQLPFSISVSGLQLHTDETFNLWINALEFHRDPEKRVLLHPALQVLGTDALRALLCISLHTKVKAIVAFAEYARVLLKPGKVIRLVNRPAESPTSQPQPLIPPSA
jgi:hypothetical protein